ncbi:hypothetical protein O7627_32840 [Solwaraspora sp. WMMD1047]|uniref:hypothetical protein n=1 Tax=Solwaraspora sp. WMMD1047 TaxID=3016102 RepID=UPI002416BA3D|nr:hypothetical protein [Solwaraspora sp. WMMD1047]MDG4834056.1 hypothetical protein [Solwaraspora sp. WMMD1047]
MRGWLSAPGVRERLPLHLAAAAVTVLVLGPAVGPGYLLRYDMVFVPRQPLRDDLIASADALPRAVPQDTVVSLANLVVPGWLLQWIVLVAVLWFAAVGAGRLVPAARTLTRLVATVGYAWTPFLAERLLLGQWGLLLAYAALPWLVAALLGLRTGQPGALPRLVVAAAASAITPTGGVLALLTTAALLPGSGRPAPVPPSPETAGPEAAGPEAADRVPAGPTPAGPGLAGRGLVGRVLAGPGQAVVALGAVLALNAPWLAAAAVTTAGGRSDPDGVAAFAARAENWAGPYLALAGTGGIWNAQTTPLSRGSVFVPLVTIGLLGLAAAGFPLLRRRWQAGSATRFAGLAVGVFLLAAAGTLPGGGAVLRWLVAEVPGAGLLRDGQKLLIPYAGFLVVCAALGAERAVARLRRPGDRIALVGLVLLPVVVLPDLAFGAAGRLRPAGYPDDWRTVAAVVRAEPGPVLSLPLSMYRSYPWNSGPVVIDPLPRYLPVEVLTDDTLLVGDLVVAGENRRVDRIRDLVAGGGSIRETWVRWVVVQHGVGGTVPPAALAGLRPVHLGPDLSLYENPAAGGPAGSVGESAPARRPALWPIAMLGTGLAAVVLAGALGRLIYRARRRLFRTPTPW